MKYIFVFLFIFVSFFEISAQIDRNRQYDGIPCEEIKETFRLRIVTLSTPDLWEPINVSYVMETEKDYYVFFTKEIGSYCRMLELQTEIPEYMTKIVRVR
jgi:hypothetical protein